MKIRQFKYNIKAMVLATTLGCTLLTAGCNKKEESYDNFQNIMKENEANTCFDDYLLSKTVQISTYGGNGTLEEVTLFDAIEELEKVLNSYNKIPEIDLGSEDIELDGKYIIHKVKSGEELSEIGAQYGLTLDEIMEDNNMDSGILYEGDRLKISVDKLPDELDALLTEYQDENTDSERKIEVAKKLQMHRQKAFNWLDNFGQMLVEKLYMGLIKSYVADALDLSEESISKITIESENLQEVKVIDYTIEDDKIKSSTLSLGGSLEDALSNLYSIQGEKQTSISKLNEGLNLVKKIVSDYKPIYENRLFLGEKVSLSEKQPSEGQQKVKK